MSEYRHLWGPFADRVHWLGPLEKPALYSVVKGAVAAVLPSRADNLPNTVSESLMFDVPVIGFNAASLDEMVEAGASGELVPDGDVGQLAAAMLRAWRGETKWRHPPAILAAMEPQTAAGNLLRLAGLDRGHASLAVRHREPAGSSDPLRLLVLDPPRAQVGEGFNIQSNGRSAFSVRCERAGLWTTVLLDDEPLETTFGSPTWLTALAPAGLFDRPGRHLIRLVDEFRGASNDLEFTVEAAPAGRECH
jgi:hypothetical protein